MLNGSFGCPLPLEKKSIIINPTGLSAEASNIGGANTRVDLRAISGPRPRTSINPGIGPSENL
jgi:hypothetical protein